MLQQGWTDALPKKYPKETLCTFRVYRRNRRRRDAGLRLDHILLLKTLARRLTAAGTDRAARGQDGPINRAPLWVGLR